MKRKAVKIRGEDGEVCIQPPLGSFDPALTMCLYIENNGPFVPTNDPVTCESCQLNFDTLKNGLKLTGV